MSNNFKSAPMAFDDSISAIGEQDIILAEDEVQIKNPYTYQKKIVEKILR